MSLTEHAQTVHNANTKLKFCATKIHNKTCLIIITLVVVTSLVIALMLATHWHAEHDDKIIIQLDAGNTTNFASSRPIESLVS